MQLVERLETGEVVIIDGGMGTSVQDLGVDIQDALWGSAALLTAAGRALNDRVHDEFIAAGAELLIANTHNASLEQCARYLADYPEVAAGAEVLMRGVNAAALASAHASAARASSPSFVAACLMSPDVPYAKEASLTAAEISGRLGPQVSVFEQSAADLVIFELLTTAADLEGVRRAAAVMEKPFAVGVACGPDGRTLGGVALADAVSAFSDRPPLAWFVQCTQYPVVSRALEPLMAAIDPSRSYVGVYANDGRSWSGGQWHGDRVTPDAYCRHAHEWIAQGARLIGGCCGTQPAHIAALRDAVRGT